MSFGHFLAQLKRLEHLDIWTPAKNEALQASPAGDAHFDGCSFFGAVG